MRAPHRHLLSQSVSDSLLPEINTSSLNIMAVPQIGQLVVGFPPWRTGFEAGSGHAGFVVDKAAMGQVFSKSFGLPCQAFHRLLHIHQHPSSSGAAIIGQ
jgi:hypothetical protein